MVFDKELAKIHSKIYDTCQLEQSREKFLRMALLYNNLAYQQDMKDSTKRVKDSLIISDVYFERFLSYMKGGL